ncbi:MAG TPA: NUDIX hydrolase [Solirubrobacteraceae bacterium]|nr:NUDIX hydrolase [Solirubrobacteraceae bacterium]
MRTSEEGERPRPAGDARPAAGEEYNPGPPSTPRRAASVILLRGGAEALQALLVRRTPRARFMGGVWVFPGGAVDTGDGEDERAPRLAAVRELREEAGVALEDPAGLVRFSRWITPEQVRIRFDTHFFLAELPPGQEPRVDGQECVELGWFTPQEALDAHRAGALELVFPTIKHLEQLREFASVDALLSYARGRDVQPVRPRVVLEGEVARILLPDEPGY